MRLASLVAASAAWNGGMGAWPQMSQSARIALMSEVVDKLLLRREEMANVLMHEIGKNYKDAYAEVDRTITFIRSCVEEMESGWGVELRSWKNGVVAYIRRSAIGVILALGPANYPLNETYAMIIPALLTGNCVVLKIPAVGGLVHLLTISAFQSVLPPGVVTFVSGGGRVTCPPAMETGLVDGLAFIGSSSAADSLIRSHKEPHRLKVFSQLEAKNMAVFLPDVVAEDGGGTLDSAVSSAVGGALSYNGQRCTALKLFFVPRSSSSALKERVTKEVQELRVGMPWENMEDGGPPSQITPLPNRKRVEYMQELIDDARSKGAEIVGGEVLGGEESTLMRPAVVWGVKVRKGVVGSRNVWSVVRESPTPQHARRRRG